jgi:hypothetical protein
VYTVLIGASAADIRLSGDVQVDGEAVSACAQGSWYTTLQGRPTEADWSQIYDDHPTEQERCFTMNSTCEEMHSCSLLMRLAHRVMLWVIAARYGGGKKAQRDPAYHMLRVSATDCPLRAMVINGGGLFPEWLAHAVLRWVNFWRGFRC